MIIPDLLKGTFVAVAESVLWSIRQEKWAPPDDKNYGQDC